MLEKLFQKMDRMAWLTADRWSGRIEGENLSCMNLPGKNLEDCVFAEVNFSGANLSFSHGEVHFLHCDFGGARLVGTQWRGVHFEDCRLEDADFGLSDWRDGSASGCNFRGDHTGYAGADLTRFRFLGKPSLFAAGEVRGSCILEGADVQMLQDSRQYVMALAHAPEHLHQVTDDPFWPVFAALIRGTKRSEATCWAHFMAQLDDHHLEEFLAFVRENYPLSGILTRFRIEQAKEERAQGGMEEPLILSFPKGRLVIGDQFGRPNVMQPEGASSFIENEDGMLEDVAAEDV